MPTTPPCTHYVHPQPEDLRISYDKENRVILLHCGEGHVVFLSSAGTTRTIELLTKQLAEI